MFSNANKQIRYTFLFSTVLTGIFTIIFHQGALDGFMKIMTGSAQVYTSYPSLGGLGGTFLNAFLVQCIMCLLYFKNKRNLNGTSFLAFFLTFGFTFWGINPLNMLICFFGTALCLFFRKQDIFDHTDLLLFSTGIAPLYSELLFHCSFLSNMALQISLALFISLIVGLFLPPLLSFGNNIHGGYCIYNAAWPIGLLTILAYSIFFRFFGGLSPVSSALGIQEGYPVPFMIYAVIFFGAILVYGTIKGGWKSYLQLITDSGYQADYVERYGMEAVLMNMGVFGILVTALFYQFGAVFNGVTFGILFCMTCTASKGSHIRNVLPIIIGYVIAVVLQNFAAPVFHNETLLTLGTQSVVVGLCYANGLSVISGKFGSAAGVIAGIIHLTLVLCIPPLHGAFCLYNGGFTAVITAAILYPVFEHYSQIQH